MDNKEELKEYATSVKVPFKLGIRVAAEEEPNFPFYTSRLGIRAKDILEFYVDRIEGYESKFQLKMLHIFLNKGIKIILNDLRELDENGVAYSNTFFSEGGIIEFVELIDRNAKRAPLLPNVIYILLCILYMFVFDSALTS